MRQRFDRLIAAQITLENGHDIPQWKRLENHQAISEALQDWGSAVFPDESYEWYQMFKEHSILPFAGAWVDQPWYVQHDFKLWRMLEQWHRFNEKLSSTEGLPTVDEFLENQSQNGSKNHA